MAVASVLVTTNAFAAEESLASLTAEAKITEAQARTTALAKVPHGTVKSAGLEREHGRLVWSFDLSQPSAKGVTEVQGDAKSGKIVSAKKERLPRKRSRLRRKSRKACQNEWRQRHLK